MNLLYILIQLLILSYFAVLYCQKYVPNYANREAYFVSTLSSVKEPKFKPENERNEFIDLLSSLFFSECGPMVDRKASWPQIITVNFL